MDNTNLLNLKELINKAIAHRLHAILRVSDRTSDRSSYRFLIAHDIYSIAAMLDLEEVCHHAEVIITRINADLE